MPHGALLAHARQVGARITMHPTDEFLVPRGRHGTWEPYPWDLHGRSRANDNDYMKTKSIPAAMWKDFSSVRGVELYVDDAFTKENYTWAHMEGRPKCDNWYQCLASSVRAPEECNVSTSAGTCSPKAIGFGRSTQQNMTAAWSPSGSGGASLPGVSCGGRTTLQTFHVVPPA